MGDRPVLEDFRFFLNMAKKICLDYMNSFHTLKCCNHTVVASVLKSK